ncbi:MAG: hypothetical protein EOO09_04415 [Chitinophagaceae bacterium]|nr:MAG: hypothetical protein EOO09_04415 [Chitinophagaceae bacterium]
MRKFTRKEQDHLLENAAIDLPAIAGQEAVVLLYCDQENINKSVALIIHDFSPRSDRGFLSISCITKEIIFDGQKLLASAGHGLEELISMLARGSSDWLKRGTVFISDLAALPVADQEGFVKTLSQAFNCRIIADMCSSKKTMEISLEGNYISDVIKVIVPALRDNIANIQFFSNYYLVQANLAWARKVVGISPEASRLLQRYSWVGHLPELREIMFHSLFFAEDGDELQALSLPSSVRSYSSDALSLKVAILNAERRRVMEVLQLAKNNKKKAAEMLKISRKTLYAKLRLFGEHPENLN